MLQTEGGASGAALVDISGGVAWICAPAPLPRSGLQGRAQEAIPQGQGAGPFEQQLVDSTDRAPLEAASAYSRSPAASSASEVEAYVRTPMALSSRMLHTCAIRCSTGIAVCLPLAVSRRATTTDSPASQNRSG